MTTQRLQATQVPRRPTSMAVEQSRRHQAPLAEPDAVQAHGVLLALDDDLAVVMCSANTDRLLGVAVDEVLGKPLAALVGTDVSARIAARRDEGFPVEPLIVVLGRAGIGSLGGAQVEVRLHASGQRTVVELEPAALSVTAHDVRITRTAMTHLTAATALDDLTALLAREVRELVGFDRVCVVRLDRMGAGEVVAQDLGPGAPAMGSHIDARSAGSGSLGGRDRDGRAHHHQVQLLADVAASPAALVPPLDPDTGAPLDLSRALLRAADRSTIDLLDVDGVTASLTIAMLVDDEQWGQVVCDHFSGSRRPAHDSRSAATFFAQMATHLIAHRERADARESAALTRGELSQLTARLAVSEGAVLDALFADPGLLSVFGASGAANLFEQQLRTQGVTPDLATMQQISDVLNLPDTYTSSTDRLAGLDGRFAELSSVADGVLRVGTMGDRWGLWFRTDGSRWQPWHVEAAEELGRKVNSLLLLRSREQVAMAESMQRSVVLDRAPSFVGVELVARYRPATSYQLGGDWWDAFQLDERRLAFVVGDVAGHGVAAASAMTQVRTALRAYLYDGHDPADALDRLDRLMDGLLDIGVATALVAVLDRETGLVEIASAGHPDPLLIEPGGGVTEVVLGRRPMLGVGAGRAPATVLELSAGARLVFFTDGLVERRGRDTEEQTAHLMRLAGGELRPAPLEDLGRWCDLVLAELDTIDDDTTVLAFGRA